MKRGDILEYLYERKQAQLALVPSIRIPPQNDLAITNVQLIPMTYETVLSGYTVLIRDGIIAKVGPVNEVEIDDSFQIVDVRGQYLMPGLADMHVHMNENAFNHRLFVINGVTTVREMSGSEIVLGWIENVERNEFLAPDIYTASPIIRGRDREPTSSSIVLKTGAETKHAVQELYRRGYRILKPYTYLSREVYEALVHEAKELGMAVVGHVPYSVGVQGVIDAGQDEIAHIHSFHQDFFVDFDRDNVFKEYVIDESKIPEIAQSVSQAKVRVTTSLLVNQALLDSTDIDEFVDRPMQAYEVGWVSLLMRTPNFRLNKMWSAEYLDKQYLPWIYRLIKALHDANVILVLGTDSGVPGLVHGFSTQEELKLLVKAGLTPYEALLTATRNAAVAVGDSDVWGTIEVGKRANLIVLSENPLQDINNIGSIDGVVLAGRWINREMLNEVRTEVRDLVN